MAQQVKTARRAQANLLIGRHSMLNWKEWLAFARSSMKPRTREFLIATESGTRWVTVTRRGLGRILTPAGGFWEYEFELNDAWRWYNVPVKCEDVDQHLMPRFSFPEEDIAVRIDSGCATGQVFGDVSCECKQQLELGMRQVSAHGQGLIIEIPSQDGRGQGLGFKLATLTLQDKLGMDTVEAARSLLPKGKKLDARTYAGCVAILRFFGIERGAHLKVFTNNHEKLEILERNGYLVSRKACVIAPTRHTFRHLAAKQRFFHHEGLVGASYSP